MIIQTLAFYLFAVISVIAGAMVISARNPVHSVLFLILAFFSSAGLFVLMGAEFLAMILVVVYVGAVAVLFLFVVMMLDINFVELREGFLRYSPIGALVGVVLLIELGIGFTAWHAVPTIERQCAGHFHRSRNDQHPCPRSHPLYAVLLSVPGRRPDPAGGHDRRHRPDAAPARGRAAPIDQRPGRPPPGRHPGSAQSPKRERHLMAPIGLEHYLTVAAILFTLGIFGIFLNRKNVIIILMSVELMLLAVNINFVAFSTHLGNLLGQVFAMFVLTVAAAEAAIGLAILVVYFRNRGSIAVEDINMMKG